MALFDKNLDWYDLIVPGSNMTPFINSNGAESVGKLWNDVTGVTAQQNFEKEMSNTAYQRAVADMKQAGLNPAMIYGAGGQPASTPNSGNSSSTVGSALNSIAQIFNSSAKLAHESHSQRNDNNIISTALMLAKML